MSCHRLHTPHCSTNFNALEGQPYCHYPFQLKQHVEYGIRVSHEMDEYKFRWIDEQIAETHRYSSQKDMWVGARVIHQRNPW